MKTLLALAVALLVALPAFGGSAAPPLPWTRYSDIPAFQLQPVCNNTAVTGDINDEWTVMSNDTRDVFLHSTNAVPDYVYLTAGTVASGIRVVRVLTYKDARMLYSDPCAYLLGTGA